MISTILLVAVSVSFIAYAYFHPPKILLSNQSQDSICMNYANEPFSKLKVNLVHQMTNGYKQHQLQHIKTVMKDDAHSISFELETLKRFIYHVEINARKNGKSNKELGLRIYYSRYPEIETWSNLYPDLSNFLGSTITKQFEKRHTLLMIPTIIKDKGTHMDFNPLHKETYNEEMRLFSEYQITNTTNSIPALTITQKSGKDGGTPSQNHGSLIPPADGNGESF